MMRLRAGPIVVAMALAILALLATVAAVTAAVAAERALLLEIDGAIGPPTADYIVRQLGSAKPSEIRLVILRMNTPGGLDTSMRQIISAVLASPVPVATYVAPNGARAASAGTYIAYASAIAAMAPSTNIGAATPVQFGVNPLLPSDQNQQKEKQQEGKPGEPADAETRKAVNDAVAYIRSLAALNGRNGDWAAEAVRSAASLTAFEALSLHVIDVIADDVPDLLRKIDGRMVTVAGKPQRLATVGLDVVTVPPGWRTELLALVTNPNVAFILLLIGIYGLILEFFNPGAVAPGLVGTISLLVALYALAFVPINYAGAALVLLGVALMVARGPYRRLRRARRRRHRRFCHRSADDVPRPRPGVHAFRRSYRRRRDRQCRTAAPGARGAVALAQAAGSDRQRGAHRRRGRDRVLAGRRWTGEGEGRNLARPLGRFPYGWKPRQSRQP